MHHEKELGVPTVMKCEELKNGAYENLYPLKFYPVYKDYIWGGRNLEKLGRDLPAGKVAESWEISAHHDGMSVTANGILQGCTLEDLVLRMGESLVGTESHKKYGDQFPLLLKLIDANDWLSVQVHPDDSYAAVHENGPGKTEAWFVLDAQPDAKIIIGLNREITREQLAAVINEGRLGEVLQYRDVRKGDMIYLPAGTIHAAGKGILLAEVQQCSNTTYRLHDYDRKNPDGTSRPLHIEKALDAIDYGRVRENRFAEGLRTCPEPGLTVEYLVADPHFCIQRITVEGDALFQTGGRSFHALVFLSGHGELAWKGGTLPVKACESVLIPAGLEQYRIRGQVSLLKSFIGNLQDDIIKPLTECGFTLEEIRNRVAGLDDAAG